MNEKTKENIEEIAHLYKEIKDFCDGYNLTRDFDIYFYKIQAKISKLSDYTVRLEREKHNSNIRRGVYNIYIMADLETENAIKEVLNGE